MDFQEFEATKERVTMEFEYEFKLDKEFQRLGGEVT